MVRFFDAVRYNGTLPKEVTMDKKKVGFVAGIAAVLASMAAVAFFWRKKKKAA